MCKSELLKALKHPNEELVWMKNIPLGDLDDRSFIQYWVDKTHYVFGCFGYYCPVTHNWWSREELDGAHVKIIGGDDIIYITPVHKSFNRSKDETPFQVKRKYLVPAPKQK